jgi:hypothetical protein
MFVDASIEHLLNIPTVVYYALYFLFEEQFEQFRCV